MVLKKNKGYRYVFVIIDNSQILVGQFISKIKELKQKKTLLKIVLYNPKTPDLAETDRDRGLYCDIFQVFWKNNTNKMYSRSTSLGVVFAERFNHTIRHLPKEPVFEQGDGNWIDILPAITKQYKNRVQISTKLTPIQSSFKKNEGYVYKNLIDKRKKWNRSFK